MLIHKLLRKVTIYFSKKQKKTLLKNFLSKVFSTGGGIRTPINGFGDRYSTLELHPYFKKVLSFLEPKTFLYDH